MLVRGREYKLTEKVKTYKLNFNGKCIYKSVFIFKNDIGLEVYFPMGIRCPPVRIHRGG